MSNVKLAVVVEVTDHRGKTHFIVDSKHKLTEGVQAVDRMRYLGMQGIKCKLEEV